MENNQLQPLENAHEPFDEIIEQFSIAMAALQLQDIQSSEQALIRAKLTFNSVDINNDPEEARILQLIVGFIEVGTRFIRSTFYGMEERFQKSLDELQAAEDICKEAKKYFSQTGNVIVDEEVNRIILEPLKFLYAYFDHLIKVIYSTNLAQIEKKQGKYIDEVANLRKSAKDLKNFHLDSSRILESPIGNIAIGVLGMLDRLSDLFEKKADIIEEKRGVIEFLQPVGNKVFIVHGHNEGALRELKEILEKKCRIKPIILRDESDIGKTVIEKIEEYGRQCAFAFVIITPDDIVINKDKKSYQARPNVLFELGWFCGRYGRSNVRIIRKKDTPLPSDLSGLITLDFHERIEEIFFTIKKDLKTIGII